MGGILGDITGGLNAANLGISVIKGLGGLFGLGGGDVYKAQQERQAAIANLGQSLDQQYQNTVLNNQRNLAAATGYAGDDIQSLGRRLGSSLAGAGVYNSSATAGALAQAQRGQDANLANLGAQNTYNEQQMLGANQRYLAGMQLGVGNQDLYNARQDQYNSANGYANMLGTLSQYNLARSGANQIQNAMPRSQGGYGGNSVLNPGAGGGYNGAVGTYNPYAYGLPTPQYGAYGAVPQANLYAGGGYGGGYGPVLLPGMSYPY